MTFVASAYAGAMTLSDVLHLPLDAIVFDSDGVLVDSGASVDQAWTRWAAELGLDAAEVIAYAHGQRSSETVRRYVEPALWPVFQAKVDRYEIDDASSVTAMPGAVALAGAVPRDRWAVVTSGNRVLATARLTAARIPVPPFVVTADDVVHGKPHPEGYAQALARLGVDPARAAVAEDSAAGIEAALAAGTGTVIGVGLPAMETRAHLVVRDLGAARWTDGGLLIAADGRLR